MATAQTLLISQDDPISFGFIDWSQIGTEEAMTKEDLDVLFGSDPPSAQANEQSFLTSYPPSQEEARDASSLSPGTSQAQFTPSSTLQDSFQDEESGEDAALNLVAASTTSPAGEYELSPFSSHSSNYSYSFPHGSESALTPPFANEASGTILSSQDQQSWQSFGSSEGDQSHPALQPSTSLDYTFSGFHAPSNVAFNDQNFLTNFHLPLRTLPSSQPWLPTTIQSFTSGPTWGNFQHSTELQQQGHVVPLPQNPLLPNPHMMQDSSALQMPATNGPSHSTFTWAPGPPFEDEQAADLSQHNPPATHSHATRPRLAPNDERIQHLQQTKDTITKRKQASPYQEKTKQQGSTGSKRSERPLAVASSPTTPESREGHSDPGPKPVRGGRKKHTHLNPQARQRSSAMRKMGACWRCKLQRDPCPDDGSPCGRCLHVMEKHNGPHVFFACDRSKLPDFVFDFLPPSYTVMHSKQNIEDTVQDQVRLWDLARPINVFFTSGFGHPLRWTLYEFQPSTVELLAQFQYLQNTQTRQSERFEKWSPPLGIIKLEPSDDWHFKNYLDELMMDEHLMEFPWTCFEEESQFDNFQADMLALICQLYRMTPDQDLRSLLHKIIRMMIITYIMGHTLTITQETLPAVHYHLRNPNKPHYPAPHTSPRLANRQLKFFFHVLRHQIFEEILKWQQATFQTAGSKDSTWLSSFLVILALAMVLEEAQRTMQIQADAKARKRECSYDGSQQEARNACERIDERFALLVGLFQCKYRDKKWVREGSFGPQTPRLRCPVAHDFCQELRGLLMEKQHHLRTRKDVPFCSQNQCFYTSRLVARFLLPFLNLPA